MQVKDECQACYHEIQETIAKAELQWQTLEAQVQRLEESLFEDKFELFEKWFGLERADVGNWIEGGFRDAVREKINSLVLQPLQDKMLDKVDWAPPVTEEDGDRPKEEEERNLLAELSAFCGRVQGALGEAAAEDQKLDKKIRKTEKEERSKGIVGLGMQDSKKVAALKRTRPGIWEVPKSLLEEFTAPVKRLNAFLSVEMLPELIEYRLSETPAILCRALSDWHFAHHHKEMEQIQKWWDSTKAVVTQNPELWEELQKKEELFIKRIERGLEEVRIRKHRYASYANFGINKVQAIKGLTVAKCDNDLFWTDELWDKVNLVAKVLGEMRERLKQIRDSAMWRVIETARQIQKQLDLASESAEPPPWEKASALNGAQSVLEKLDGAAPYPDLADLGVDAQSGRAPLEGDALEEVILATMKRMDCIIEIAYDIRDFFGKGSAERRQAIETCMDSVAKAVAGLHEELLCVLDEATAESAREWLMLWGQWSGTELAREIEDAMQASPLRKDSELNGRALEQRRERLVRLRGLQALVEGSESLRSQVVDALHADVSGAPRPPGRAKPCSPALRESSGKTEVQTARSARELQDIVLVEELQSDPPSPAEGAANMSARASVADAMTSHRGPKPFAGGSMHNAGRQPGSGTPTPQMMTPQRTSPATSSQGHVVPPLKLGIEGRSGSPYQGYSTPPDPWPEGARPYPSSGGDGTPIPGAEDLEVSTPTRPSSAKFVDGQYIPLRPNSAQTRLPPLNVRNAWS